MNMGSLERQLMDSFKDMDTLKKKKKNQKDVAQIDDKRRGRTRTKNK